MNYLLQLVAFKKHRMLKPLSANAITLYHTLLEYSNEIGFPHSFTAANSTLQGGSSLSRQKVQQARSLLIEGGYITYIIGSGSQCGTYSLPDLTIKYDNQTDAHSDIQPDTQADTETQSYIHTVANSDLNSGTQTLHKVSTLTKQDLNEIKQNKTNTNMSGGKESQLFFDAFWKDYPKKQGKSEALKAFLKLSPDKELLYKMLEAIKLFSRTESWKRGNGQYIPLPSTWLNGKRWEDEAVTISQPEISEWNGECPY
ncbi:MAG: hypothetical protein ACYCWE_07180 [Eubacteriales bacterium]